MPELQIQRIVRSLHTLDAPPLGAGWNRIDIADLIQDTPSVEAAVLVGLIERDGVLTVLLTLRGDHLSRHAGQVSFPGGRVEAADAGPTAAAMRETFEEVGIEPRWIQPLGFLDPLETITSFRVVPVVARLLPGFLARPDGNEVSEIFEAPLSVFLDESKAKISEIEFGGQMRTIHEFDIEGRRVWGATAAMLINLRTRMKLLT